MASWNGSEILLCHNFLFFERVSRSPTDRCCCPLAGTTTHRRPLSRPFSARMEPTPATLHISIKSGRAPD